VVCGGLAAGVKVPVEACNVRPDTEVAVGACIGYLSERGDVDPSLIAFYGGGEPGGWVAVRAAAREPRIAACVADPYVADSDAILSVLRRPDIAALSERPQTVPGQAQQTARFYEGEPGRGYLRMVSGAAAGSGARCYASTIPATMRAAPAGRRRRRGGTESGQPPSGLHARGRHRPVPPARQLQPQAPGHVRLAGRRARPTLTRPAAPAGACRPSSAA
jgi:hypothetical protein